MWIEFDGLRVKEILELAGLTKSAPIYMHIPKKCGSSERRNALYCT
ncbi:hypothetical protein [Faecalimonas umbilicata]